MSEETARKSFALSILGKESTKALKLLPLTGLSAKSLFVTLLKRLLIEYVFIILAFFLTK
jgi:hypothetical protein